MSKRPFLVDCDWLNQHLSDSDLSIVDASWYLPTMLVDGESRNGKAEFNDRHIPGAVYFDIDEITQPNSQLPHTLAPAALFAQKVSELGISDQDRIVVYDGMGLFSAARVWWNFRIMGAQNVFILDGGLPKWLECGFPVESGQLQAQPKTFSALPQSETTVSFDSMMELVGNASAQIADARPATRFTGETPEPRAGMRSGHMPGAYSVPASDLAPNGQLLPVEDLRSIFVNAGIDLNSPVVTTCGSGVTAAILTLALESIKHTDNRLYDGSWSEWGGRDDTAVVTGN
ncbi:MAG: 3-mercaptopyruvate sulfurtransferase [Rhizobiaceae bacterium]